MPSSAPPLVHLSPAGGLWVARDKVQKALGASESELRKIFHERKELYCGVAKADGYHYASSGGRAFFVLPARFTHKGLTKWGLKQLEDLRTAFALHRETSKITMPRKQRRKVPAFKNELTVTLHQYQESYVAKVMRYYARPTPGSWTACVDAEAGSGKTVGGIEICRRVGERVIVVVPGKSNVEQWVESFQFLTPGVQVVDLRLIKNLKTRPAAAAEADVVVVTPTLALQIGQGDEPWAEWGEFGVAVFDECHAFCSPEWRKLLARCSSARLLGLSASTGAEAGPRGEGRADGLDVVGRWYFGRPILVSKLEGFAESRIAWAGNGRVLEVEDLALAGRIADLELQGAQALFNDPRWVQLVVEEARRILCMHKTQDIRAGRSVPTNPSVKPYVKKHPKHNLVLFCEHREAAVLYAQKLHDELGDKVLFVERDGKDVKSLIGGATKEERLAAMEHARVVVTTFAYSSVGISYNRFTAELHASTRRTRLYQILARVLRAKSDTSIVREYTVLAGPKKSWRSHAGRFRATCKYLGFPVETLKINLPAPESNDSDSD